MGLNARAGRRTRSRIRYSGGAWTGQAISDPLRSDRTARHLAGSAPHVGSRRSPAIREPPPISPIRSTSTQSVVQQGSGLPTPLWLLPTSLERSLAPPASRLADALVPV